MEQVMIIRRSLIFIVYNGGRYWIWPFHAFVTFPSTLKTIEFSDRPGA